VKTPFFLSISISPKSSQKRLDFPKNEAVFPKMGEKSPKKQRVGFGLVREDAGKC